MATGLFDESFHRCPQLCILFVLGKIEEFKDNLLLNNEHSMRGIYESS